MRVSKVSSLLLGLVLSVGLYTTALAGGSVTGTIKFDGKAPNFKVINMDADPICSTAHKDPVYP